MTDYFDHKKMRTDKNYTFFSFTLLLSIVGFLSSFYVNFGGQLYITEIIFIILLPFLLVPGRIYLQTNLKRLLMLGTLWLLVQMITDLARGTPVNDFLRGWAGIGFLLLDIFVLYVLVDRQPKRIVFFLLGHIFGDLTHLFFQPSPFFAAEPWKFGFAGPVILLVLLLIAQSSKYRLEWAKYWFFPLFALGSLSLYLNSRTNAWLIFLTAGLILLRFSQLGRRLLFLRMRFGSLIVLGLFVITLTFGVLKAYQYTVSEGWLGEEARAKYLNQYNPKFGVAGIILGGRNQMLGSIQAIADSPFWGQGSWARDPKYRQYVYQLEELGYTLSGNIENYVNKTDLIPAHGHFFQAWIWAGPLGAFFWVFVAIMVVRATLRSFQQPNQFFPLLVFLSASAIWDIFFSPFGASMRMNWAYTLVTIFFVISPVNKPNSSALAVSQVVSKGNSIDGK